MSETKKYKLHSTDGKTFFHFRSNPNSMMESFTVSYLNDGTCVMSGDYGVLSWKRHIGGGDKDYGFPSKETNLGYFEEKISHHGISQKIREWKKEKAIERFKGFYEEQKDTTEFKNTLKRLESLEEHDEVRFFEILSDFDSDFYEYTWASVVPHFVFMFELLQNVSEQIWRNKK